MLVDELKLIILDGLNIDESTPPSNAMKRISNHIDKTFGNGIIPYLVNGNSSILDFKLSLFMVYEEVFHGKM